MTTVIDGHQEMIEQLDAVDATEHLDEAMHEVMSAIYRKDMQDYRQAYENIGRYWAFLIPCLTHPHDWDDLMIQHSPLFIFIERLFDAISARGLLYRVPNDFAYKVSDYMIYLVYPGSRV